MKMPDFPEETAEVRLAKGFVNSTVSERYERSRAEAWEARARLAVQALKRISTSCNGPSAVAGSPKFDLIGILNDDIEIADNALDAIGELPPA